MIQCGFHRIFYKKNLAKLLKVAQERKRRKNKRSFKHYSNANEEAPILSKKKKKKSPSDVRAVMTTFNILRGKPRTLKPAPDIAPALHIGWRAFFWSLFFFFLSFPLLPVSSFKLRFGCGTHSAPSPSPVVATHSSLPRSRSLF